MASSKSKSPTPETESPSVRPAQPVRLEVRSQRDGLYRGGRRWTSTPTIVSTDEFTDEELVRIRDEPRLQVRVVSDDEVTASEGAGQGGGEAS